MLERQDLATGKLEVLFQVGWSGAAVEGGVQGWGRGNSECWGRGTDANMCNHARSTRGASPHVTSHTCLKSVATGRRIVVPRGLGSGDGESDLIRCRVPV